MFAIESSTKERGFAFTSPFQQLFFPFKVRRPHGLSKGRMVWSSETKCATFG